MSDEKTNEVLLTGLQNIPDTDFRLPLSEPEAFKRALEGLPLPVYICTPDGAVVFLNAAARARTGAELLVGRYSFLRDSEFSAAMAVGVKRVLAGDTVLFPGARLPFSSATCCDVTIFPLLDKGLVTHFALMEAQSVIYGRKSEVERAKEHMLLHRNEKFDLTAVVKASGLSQSYFARSFKRQTGQTPHEFFTGIKIDQFKEKLLEPGITAAQAYAACEIDDREYFARVFKKTVGISPAEYRRRLIWSEKSKNCD